MRFEIGIQYPLDVFLVSIKEQTSLSVYASTIASFPKDNEFHITDRRPINPYCSYLPGQLTKPSLMFAFQPGLTLTI